jgi:hypothetical protein
VFVAIDSFLRPPGVPTIQDEELSRGATVVGVE